MTADEYPQGPINKIKRYNHQANYDVDFVRSVFNSTPVLHVSFVPDPSTAMPVILPLIGQMGLFPGDEEKGITEWSCYLHGYVTSRIMKLTDDAVKRGEPGMPICVAATRVDGFVLTLTPNSHNYNYRSAVLHGHSSIVDNDKEKLWAMELITNSVIPDRWQHTRVPPDSAEMQSTRIMKVKIAAASGKVREGIPTDERKDMKREDVLDRVWTGVIPVYETYGDPQPGPYNRIKDVPEHVEDFVLSHGEINERYAYDAAHKPPPEKRKKDGESDED